MRKQNNNNKRVQKKRAPRSRQQPARAPAAPKRRTKTKSKTHMGPVERLISDPCKAPLKEGYFATSEGFLQRFHHSTAHPTTVNNPTSGFLLWCPDRHGVAYDVASGGGAINSLWFAGADPQANPSNTATLPLALHAQPDAANGSCISDPAAGIVSSFSSLAADYRHLSSCMRLTYTGPLQSTQGEIAFLSNIPSEIVLAGSQPVSDLSVDTLFVRASKTLRLSTDTYENVYRPDVVHPAQWVNHSGGGAFHGGTIPTIPSFVTSNEANIRPRWFGFAYRGMTPAIIEALRFDRYKVVEFRPNFASGMPGAVPRGVSEHPNPAARALTLLDRTYPDWASRVLPTAMSVAASVARMAFTGV